jgi:RimJ/RimL family protein N-acetyltransferase
MWTRQAFFRRASARDIGAIMEIERQPGYELLVGRWSVAQHLKNISQPGLLYLVHDNENGMPIAFAALTGMGHRDGDVMINRMIVREPDKGVGTRALRAVMELAFEGAPTTRLWLRVLPDNHRALHVYRSQGFRDERLLPGAGTGFDGRRLDLLLMSILYEDWAAKRQN